MNHEDRINQLEKHIQSAQTELSQLKADMVKDTEVDIYAWVFKNREEAEWTRRHELAWRKLRYYADKLNPPGWRPLTGDVTWNISWDNRVIIPFHSAESAERALRELGDDVNYLWSWNRKPEERAR